MTPSLLKIGAIYLILVNLVSFIAFGVDKWKAKRHRWRIPESTLLALSLAGGWLGALLGMRVFRHKTRKPKFMVGVPLTAALWVVLLALAVRTGVPA